MGTSHNHYIPFAEKLSHNIHSSPQTYIPEHHQNLTFRNKSTTRFMDEEWIQNYQSSQSDLSEPSDQEEELVVKPKGSSSQQQAMKTLLPLLQYSKTLPSKPPRKKQQCSSSTLPAKRPAQPRQPPRQSQLQQQQQQLLELRLLLNQTLEAQVNLSNRFSSVEAAVTSIQKMFQCQQSARAAKAKAVSQEPKGLPQGDPK